jgi:very-short-patch-repair endonuclease
MGGKMGARINVTAEQCKKLYDKGFSAQAIEKKLGLDRKQVKVRLESLGIKIRNKSEAQTLRNARMTKTQRLNNIFAAQNARRGQKSRRQTLIDSALAIYGKQRISKYELKLANLLKANRLKNFKMLYPVFKYNIDIAFPFEKIAVEIHGGDWHSSTRKSLQDAKKLNYLSKKGWFVLYIHSRDIDVTSLNLKKLIIFLRAYSFDPDVIN